MNYEKKYKEALEVAQKLYQDCPNGKNDRLYHTTDLEKMFPELAESEDEKTRKRIIALVNAHGQGIYKGDMLTWLEKQGEQKPADNFKQKFKVGDWVTNGLCVWRIDSIDEDMYYTNHCGIDCGGDIKSIDEEYHIWTIQDAKNGDVLFMDNGSANCIFIYKSSNNGIINKYASYNNFGFEGEHYLVLNDGYVIPATKEQRDLLFTKMREAGYEWSDKDRKLIKIVK